jgi:hypothetical protein
MGTCAPQLRSLRTARCWRLPQVTSRTSRHPGPPTRRRKFSPMGEKARTLAAESPIIPHHPFNSQGPRWNKVSGILMHVIELKGSLVSLFVCLKWCWGPAICMFFMHCSTKKAITWRIAARMVVFRAHD